MTRLTPFLIIKKSAELALLLLIILFFAGCGNNSDSSEPSGDQSWLAKGGRAEKIEVIHFHGNQQCWSCVAVGEYALKTIKEKFPEEYKSGKIVFKDINGELPANKDMVIKYQASGSSLFINAIKDGKDNIEEDVNVWRYIYNEAQFVGYFENKLKNLMAP